MCYPKPGPRCSSHAFTALTRSMSNYAANPDFENFEAMKKAQADYDMTPRGQKELLKEIMRNGDETGLLNTRLTYGRQMRELALAAIRSDDKGDNDNHRISELQEKIEVLAKSEGPEAERIKTINHYKELLDQPEMRNHAVRELTRSRSMLSHPSAKTPNSSTLIQYVDNILNSTLE